jgi:hypothetical protein
VLKPAKQALLAQQALHKGEVRLKVLGAQAAQRVGGGIGQLPAPSGCQLALGLVVGKDFRDDVDDGFILEDPGILAVCEEGRPGLDGEFVAGQTAIGAEQGEGGDVAVKWA